MLVLDRKAQEGLWIGERIYVKVLGIRRQRVKLGIAAPSELGIAREELRLRSGAEPRAETDRRGQEREDSVDPRPVEETPDRSEAQYRALLDAIPDIIFRLSREGCFLEFIPAKEQGPAVPVGEFLGRTVYEVLPADLARQTVGHVERALQTGDTQTFEYQLPVPLPKGTLRDFEARIVVSGNDEVLAIARDITERNRAEEALRDSEARLHALVTNAPVVLFALDRDGVFTACEGKGMEPLLANPRELVGSSVFDLGRATPQIVESARRALAGESFAVTAEVAGVVFETRLAPVRGDDGMMTGVVGVATDVTERKRAEEALRESEERLRAVVENAPVGLFAIDRQGVITLSEGKAQGAMGLKSGEHVGLSMFEVYRDFPGIIEGTRRVLAGEAMTSTIRVGRVVLEVRTTPVRDHDGKITGAIGVATDVTEHHRAEEALRESEGRFRRLSAATLEGIVIDDSTVVLDANPQVAAMVGCELHEFIGQNPLSFVAPESRDLVQEHVTSAREDFVEAFGLRKDGTTFPMEVRGKAAFYEGREVRVSVVRDLAERRQVEEALRESEERLRTLVTNAPVILFAIDGEGVFTVAEGRGMTPVGLRPDEHVGRSVFDVYSDTAGVIDAARRALAGEAFSETVETENRVFEAYVTPLRDSDGAITGAIAVAAEVTERRRAEDALRASEEMWRSLVQNSPDVIMNVARDGTILLINRTLPGFPPPEQVAGANVYEFVPPQDHDTMRQALERAFQTGEPDAFETAGGGPQRTISHYATRLAPVKHDGEVASVNLIATDVTELRRAEEALQRAREELESRAEHAMRRGNPYGLTFRELTVLHLVSAGRADKEIAFELAISPRTANKHLENILHKMGSPSRTEAGVRAVREGLLGQAD